MLESLDHHFISEYTNGLRRELLVQGFKSDRIDEVVSEAAAHLEEAMTETNPQSADAVMRVIEQFGSAAVLARRLAAEELRATRRRWFLWPALFIPPALYVSMHPLPQTRVFHDSLYIGTLYLLISAAVLFLMGVRARRPQFGQFVALVLGMIVCEVGWYAATSYPVAYGPAGSPEWYQAVPRSGVQREIASLNRVIASRNEAIKQISLGQRVFTGVEASKIVPSQFIYGDRYWLPEGVREVGLGIKPQEISKDLLTSSWSTAVRAYNSPANAPWTSASTPWEGDAARQLRQIPEESAMYQRAIDYLGWMRTQPLSVQLVADYRMVALPTVAFVALGALCTNAGWLAWILSRALGRLRRRIAYGGSSLKAV